MAETVNAGEVRSQLVLDVSKWLQGLREAQTATDAFQQRLGQVRLPEPPSNSGAHAQGLRQIEQAAQGSQVALAGMTASIVRGGLALAGIAGGIQLVRAGIGGLIDNATQLQRLDAAFTAIGGSSLAASRNLTFVRELADKLGFSFLTLVSGFKGFEAASQGTVLAGTETQRIFTAIATASRSLQLSQADLQGVLIAVQQIMSKGTVSSEELRQQLGERLPGAFQVAARAMGVTTSELSRMLEQGSILSTTFLPRFASQLQREFGQGATATRTFTESFARLGNAFTDLGGTLNQSGVLTWLGSIADKLAEIIKSGPQAARAVDTIRERQAAQEVKPLQERGLTVTPAEQQALGQVRTEIESTRKELADLQARRATILTGTSLFPQSGALALVNQDIVATQRLLQDLEARLERLRQQTTTTAEQRRTIEGLGEPADVGEAFQKNKAITNQVRQTRQQIDTDVRSITDAMTKADDAIAGATNGQQRLQIWQDLLQKIDEAIKKLNSTIATSAAPELLRGGGSPLSTLPQTEQETIRRIGQAQNVDPEFLAALRRTENGRAGREFGVLSVPAPTYEDQARIAAQTIAANRQRFEAQGQAATDPISGRFTPDFIRFFSSAYAPLGAANDPTGLNQAHAGNLARFYGTSAAATPAPLQALEGLRSTVLQRMRDAGEDLTQTTPALETFSKYTQTIDAGLRGAREDLDWRDPLTRNIEYLREFIDRLEAARRLDFIDPAAEAAFQGQLQGMRKTLAEFEQEQTRLQGLGVIPTDPAISARNQVQQRIESEQRSFRAELGQEAARLRGELPSQSILRERPDLAQQLGVNLGTEGQRAVASQRAQQAAQLLPSLAALPDEQQSQAVREANRVLNLQAQRAGAQGVQDLQNQTQALQARLGVMRESLVVQQREAIVQDQLNRLRAQGTDITPELEQQTRTAAAGIITVSRALEGAQRPLQEFGEKYESTFVKIQEVTLGALQKTESALVDFFSTGKFDFSGLLQGITRDLQQLTTRTLFTKPLSAALGQLFNTDAGGWLKGLVDGKVETAAYAGGGVVTRPTLALLGERGPELVTPMQYGGLVDNGGMSTDAEARAAVEGRRAALNTIYADADRRFRSSRYAGLGGAAGSGLGAVLASLIPAQDIGREQRDYEGRFVTQTDPVTGHLFIHGIDAANRIDWASRVPGAVGYVAPPTIDTVRQIGRQVLGLIGSLAGAYLGSQAAGALSSTGGGALQGSSGPGVYRGEWATAASGGRFSHPTVALIGEAGDEAVIPLRQGAIPTMIGEGGRLVAHLPRGIDIPLSMPRFADGAVVNSGYTTLSPALWANMPTGGTGRGSMATPVSLTMHVYGVQDPSGFKATQGQLMRGAALELQRQLARNG